MLMFTRAIEILLLLVLLLSALGFASFLNLYGAFLLTVTLVIAAGLFRRKRWAYIACAAWGLAGYQLAKQGYEFAAMKPYAMALGFLIVIAAIFLHETLGRVTADSAGSNDDR